MVLLSFDLIDLVTLIIPRNHAVSSTGDLDFR
jgi:hypothetical protein